MLIAQSNPPMPWGEYADSVHTSGNPQLILADTDTLVLNDGVNGVKDYTQANVLYNGTKIAGLTGRTLLITVDFTIVPTNAATDIAEFWFDLGAPIGEIYRRAVTFPKGTGQAQRVSYTNFVYTLGTWEANGASVYCRANGTCSIYNMRYLIGRA